MAAIDADTSGPDGDIQKIADPDADNLAMTPYWQMTDAIVDGIGAMKAAKETYLPKFPREDKDDYAFRLKSATMTNIYRDIVESLASKPFTQQVEVLKADTRMSEIQENVDGRGNHLHVFLGETFYRGINSAIQWVLVDYPTINIDPDRPLSQADEAALGIRPYLVQVRAIDVLHVETLNMNGVEEFSYIRLLEHNNDGDKVRVFDRRNGPTEFRVYKKDAEKNLWYLSTSGTITIGVIPMVPFYTGRRKGNSWQFYPPMRDAADLQVESLQAETSLKYARTLTCFPMLAANGIVPDKNPDGTPKPLPQGMNVVLYAEPNGDGSFGNWTRIAADAASLKFLADDVKARHEQMRELGRQPLTAQSGNVTRISAAFAANKGNSAVQAWAFGLKDAAEQMMKLMEMWLSNSTEPEVFIYTDFKVESDDNKVPDVLMAMRTNNDLSQETLWLEMKGQRILSADFDPAKEAEKLALEVPEPSPEEIAAAAGLPVPPKPVVIPPK